MQHIGAAAQFVPEALPVGEVNVRMEFAADAPKPATGGEVTVLRELDPALPDVIADRDLPPFSRSTRDEQSQPQSSI